jgi:hypoxanthine-DNA glycosylase
MNDVLTGFNYVARPTARVLILGSMPGGESLRKQEYYGHPRNLFWPFMERLFGVPSDAPYSDRLERLRQADIALWDVVHACRRRGSLDGNIEKDSVETNDFAAFFATHAHVAAVFCNGAMATQLYRKRVVPELAEPAASLPAYRLPSTSPANAGMELEEKMERWRRVKECLGG